MAQPVERQIVQRARALIATPQTWTQDEFARDQFGEPVSWRSPEAVQFCIWGALNRAAREMTGDEHQGCVGGSRGASLRGMTPSLSRLNDRGAHADVLALLDTYLQTSAA
jgi:hypothetical protein